MDVENVADSWKKFHGTCTCALMSVVRCIYGNCFVGKYFVVCFSTTKLLPPRKIPAIWYSPVVE